MTAATDSTTTPSPRRWTRRLLRWFGIAFVILLILRILLSLLLPLTIRRVAAVYGFSADYERSEINLLIGDAALWHLSLTPKGASQPAIRAGYVRGNISTLALLMLRLEIWRVEADGVEVQLDRNGDGKFPLLDQVLAAVAAPPGAAPKSKPLAFNLRSPVRIDAVRLHGTRLNFRDLGVSPPVQSTVQLNLRTSDLGSPIRPTTFELDVWSDPGLDLLHIEGQGRSDRDTLTATASLAVRGLQFAPLDPYLRPLGLSAINRGVYAHGQASVNLRASADRKSLSGKVLISDIAASADRDEFARVKEISIDLASLDSVAARLNSIRIRDVHAAAFRSAAGKIGLAGIEYVGGGARGAPAGASSPAVAPSGVPFRVQLDELRVENASAAFVDHTAQTPVALSAELRELTAKNIVIDPQAPGEATFAGAFSAPGLFQTGTVSGRFALAGPAPSLSAQVRLDGIQPVALQPYFGEVPVATVLEDARVSLTLDQIPLNLSGEHAGGTLLIDLAAPKSVGQLTIAGQLNPRAHAVAADLKLSGEGISTASIAPVLRALGIEPTWTDARISANAEIALGSSDDALQLSLTASDIELREGEQTLAGMQSMMLGGVRFSGDALAAGTVTLDHPRIRATRDREGFVTVAGIRLIGTTEATTAAAPPAPTTAPADAFPIAVQAFRVNSAEISWRDESLDQPVELTAAADVALEGLRIANDPSAGTLNVSLSSAGLVDQVRVHGTVLAAPDRAAADLKLDATGLSAEKLTAYFPPGIQSQLKNGAFAAAITAKVQAVADGGVSAYANVRDIALSDAADTLLEVGSFTTAIQRFDPAAGVIAIDEISSAGVRVNAQLASDGRLSMLGFSVGAPAPEATAAPKPAAILPAEGTAPTQDVESILAAAKKDLPLVTLTKLNLSLDRLRLENELSPGAAPVVLEGFSLTNSAPVEIGGNRPESNRPIQLALSGAIKPVAGSLTATAQATPFAAEPTAKLQLNVEGIRGESITEILPQLSRYIDGSRLSDGKFATTIEAQLQPDRRGGVPSYSRGFGADVLVRGASLTRGGETLAGVEAVHAIGARIEPIGGNVIVKTFEITKPAARILKDHQGIEALGVVAKVLAEASTAPAAEAPVAANDSAPAQAQPTPAASEGSRVADATAPSPAGGEIRIDKLLISGLDVRVEDRSVEPPIVLPLDGLDLEATGLSTRMFADSRPVRFSAVVTSGKVPIPRSVSGGIGGALGDVGMILAGKEKEISTQPVFEDREFFSQVAASGNLLLYPTASGWVKANVNGLELAGLRGFAAAFGLTLGGGILDASVDARIREDAEVIEARTRTVLTDLQLSEPAGGPISRHFKAPLDVILAAVQDADNSITLPVTVPIKRGELDKGAIVGSALGAMTGVVAAAIASTPVKVVAGVGGLLGGDKDKKPAEPRTVAIGFATGDASLLPAETKSLEQLLSQLRRDKNMELTLRHELTAGDVSIATRRANLSPEDALALGGQLRQRRRDLLSQRAEAAAAALAEVASVNARRSALAVDRLRDIDVQIAQVENALDAVLDQLKPGAERQAARRTRAAAIELGRQRLDEVRARLLESRARNFDDRVRVVTPGFAPREGNGGGQVVITVIEKKK